MLPRTIEPLESQKLSTFDRILSRGVAVYPDMYYVDANDTPDDLRRSTKRFMLENKVWSSIIKSLKPLMDYTPQIGRRYCVYGWCKDQLVGRLVFTEILNHPDGYGKNDFSSAKFIFPDFSATCASRAVSGDWYYALFMSKVANYMYRYTKINKDSKEDFILKQLDPSWPCMSKIYKSDSAEFIPYVLDKKRIESNGEEFALVEMNGHIFRNMDIYKYLRIDKRPKEVVYRTKKEMDNLTEEVLRTVCVG